MFQIKLLSGVKTVSSRGLTRRHVSHGSSLCRLLVSKGCLNTAKATFRLAPSRRNSSNIAIICSALRQNRLVLFIDSNEDGQLTRAQGGSCSLASTAEASMEPPNLAIYKPKNDASAENFTQLPIKCRGCGAFFQTEHKGTKGYILPTKVPSLMRPNSLEDLICSNCYSLKFANKPLALGIEKDNVLWQLKPLKDYRALILYVVDVMDINGSILPEVMELMGENKRVIVVGNKSDMLACDTDHKPRMQERRVENVLKSCCIEEGLSPTALKDVCLVSSVTGNGFEKLVVLINKYRDIDMNLYVVGSTNVGKSAVFNMLQNLSAISKDAAIPTQAIVHRTPGSTNGLVRQPLAYWRMKKVRRMLLEKPKEEEEEDSEQNFEFVEDIIKEVKPRQVQEARSIGATSDAASLSTLLEDDLSEMVDLHSLEKRRRWMYDTPGLLNIEQITQFLTPKELRYLQQKLWIVPKTYLMKPGRSLLLGGLARIDFTEITRKSLSDPSEYEEIPKRIQSIFFTVFCSHNIPIHPTKTENASEVYSNNFGNHILKIPFDGENRQDEFPPLQAKQHEVTGVGWERSCIDLTIAGIGWIAITAGNGCIVKVHLHTPNGIGQAERQECLMPYSVTKKGRRGTRYAGSFNRHIYESTRKQNPQFIKFFERENEIMGAWLGKIKEKQKYQLFEKKTERRRLLLEQGVKGQIRQYEEKLALLGVDATRAARLEAGTETIHKDSRETGLENPTQLLEQ